MALKTSSSNAMCPSHDGPVQVIVGTSAHSLAQDLPAEIVDLIFWQAKPEQWFIDWQSGVIRRNILWAGARVCARWRQALLGNPRLWCRSSIYLSMMDTRSVPLLCGPLVAQTLFNRTAALPIDVHFDSASAHQEEALDIITDVAVRCSSLSLRLPLSLYAYFANKSATYPVLRRLTISTHAKWDDMSYLASPRIGWEQFPLLRELSLEWREHDVGPLPSVHQLTKLDIMIGNLGAMSLVSLHSLLHGSTTLQDVRVHIEGRFTCWPQSIAIAPQVERLRLESKGTYILQCMTLPALRSLFMELPPWNSFFYVLPEQILNRLVEFLGRSGCALEEFYLSSTQVLLFEVPPVLQAMPHLKSFELFVRHQPQRAGYVAEFFSALSETMAGGNMRIVPFLERLSVCVDTGRDAHVNISFGGHFVEAVLKRTKGVGSVLRYVELKIYGLGRWDLQESDLRILKEREGQVEGLKILVIDRTRPRIYEMDSDSDSDDED
ncbi:hypothetical protein CPB85DRAFT_1562403 [Mucidula mucida]|nr:hypothetical protein CPB85DRAFT_1562403 [Mucidula mucida]